MKKRCDHSTTLNVHTATILIPSNVAFPRTKRELLRRGIRVRLNDVPGAVICKACGKNLLAQARNQALPVRKSSQLRTQK
jgi:hypothetical protein